MKPRNESTDSLDASILKLEMNMFLTAGYKPDYVHQSQCLKLCGGQHTLHRKRCLKCHPSAVVACKSGASTEITRV